MPNLYGIESAADCRKKMDELLELHRQAEQMMNTGTITAMKSTLKEYYKLGHSETGMDQMSKIERQFFWPAIQRAYVGSPNLNSPKTWGSGLSEIRLNLTYYRDQLKSFEQE